MAVSLRMTAPTRKIEPGASATTIIRLRYSPAYWRWPMELFDFIFQLILAILDLVFFFV